MSTADTGSDPDTPSVMTWLGCMVAIVGLTASVYMSTSMELLACPLCLYERTFVMGVVGVLVIGLLFRGVPRGFLSLLALPMAVGGLVVVGLHLSLEMRNILECPRGIGGIGSAPQQAAAMFVVLTAILLADAVKERFVTRSLCAIVLGGLLAWGAIASIPPRPPGNYDVPVDKDGCRKVKT